MTLRAGEKIMKCYYCKKDVLLDYEQKCISKYLLFLQEHQINVTNVSDIERDKNKIANEFLRVIKDNIDFIEEYTQFFSSLYDGNLKCPECNNSLYLHVTSSIEYPIYLELCSIELDQLNKYFENKTGRNVTALFSIPSDYAGPINFYLKMTNEFFPNDYIYFKKVHEFIDRFSPSGGRGGDGDYQIFTSIYNFLTDEFVKNALYDLIKCSAVLLTTKVVSYIRNKRVLNQARIKAEELISETENKSYYYESVLFSFMSKKEKKKLINSVTRKMKKEIRRKIKKALL